MAENRTATATILAIDGPRTPAVEQLITHHGGGLLATGADELVATFGAASAAVRAAVELLSSHRSYEPGARVGIAAGDVTWDEDGCFGIPIVAASRLHAAAAAGQILVTDVVRALAGGHHGDRYEPAGTLSLRGLPATVEAFAVQWSADQPDEPAAAPSPPPMPLALGVEASRPFVGRDGALAELRAAWAQARRGPGRLVLIGGEAGAGKTRLATELAREVAASGAGVLHGGCDTDLALPYQPWVQAADHALEALLGAEVEQSPFIEQLAPLGGLVARVGRHVVPRPSATSDPDTERYRTYEAFAAVLAKASSCWDTLVVVDDLHWAGPQTLALLRHLAHTGLPAGVLVVGTFRDTGDEVTEPLASCLADLRRVTSVARLRVGALDLTAVEHLLAATTGRPLDSDLRALAARLAHRSGGNAFYLVELLRHLEEQLSPEAEVPEGVREVVMARLARLSPPARRVIDIAAVAGQRVGVRVVEGAAELATATLDTAIEELLAARLLTLDAPTDVLGFEHAIVRDTVAGAIRPTARSRLHLAIAQALQEVHETDRRPVLADLARHYAAAVPLGPVDRALYYARRAAAQAFRAAAFDEAIAHLEAVLPQAPASTERAELLVDLGAAQLRRGSFEASREACAEAFRLAKERDAAETAAHAAMGFEVAMHFPGLPGGPAADMLRHALAMIGDGTSPLHTRVRASLGRALAFSGRTREGIETAEAAIARARADGDRESLAVALQALLVSLDEPGPLLARCAELATVAEELDDAWSASYASGNAFRAHVALGQFAAAAEELANHRRYCATGRVATFSFQVHAYEAVLALAACDFAAAEAAAERAQAMGAADEAPYDAGVYGLQMYAIRRAQGRLREVAPVLRVVAATTDPPPMWRPGLAALYAELGMREEARAAFEALAPDRFAAVPRDAVWPACLTFLAETCIALGDRDRASVLFDELAPFANRNLMAGMTICFGPADRLLGGLGVLLRRPDIDEHFAVALDLAERSGSPLWIAEVQYDWARALEVRGEAEGARRLGHQAVITARLLGIGRLAGRPVPGEHAGGEQQAAPVRAPSLPGGLSSREAEVLRLVAAGRSNREIGEALYISQNTAANHVRAILQKTGCANRAEASSYAVRHGLCDR